MVQEMCHKNIYHYSRRVVPCIIGFEDSTDPINDYNIRVLNILCSKYPRTLCYKISAEKYLETYLYLPIINIHEVWIFKEKKKIIIKDVNLENLEHYFKEFHDLCSTKLYRGWILATKKLKIDPKFRQKKRRNMRLRLEEERYLFKKLKTRTYGSSFFVEKKPDSTPIVSKNKFPLDVQFWIKNKIVEFNTIFPPICENLDSYNSAYPYNPYSNTFINESYLPPIYKPVISTQNHPYKIFTSQRTTEGHSESNLSHQIPSNILPYQKSGTYDQDISNFGNIYRPFQHLISESQNRFPADALYNQSENLDGFGVKNFVNKISNHSSASQILPPPQKKTARRYIPIIIQQNSSKL